MTAHELARLLLMGPNHRVYVRDALRGEADAAYHPVGEPSPVRLTRGYQTVYRAMPPGHTCADPEDCDECQPGIALSRFYDED